MASREVIQLCKDVQKQIKGCVKRACAEYKNCMEGINTAVTVRDAATSAGFAGSAFDTVYLFLDKLSCAESPFINQMDQALEAVERKLEEFSTQSENIEDYLYIIQQLEELVPLVEKGNFFAPKYSISFTRCYDNFLLKIQKWKNKLTTKSELRKAMLKHTVAEEEKKLKEARSLHEKNFKELKRCQDSIEEALKTYGIRAAELIAQASDELQMLLNEGEDLQREIAAMTVDRMNAVESLAKASAFGKKGKRTVLGETEKECRDKETALKEVDEKVKKFVADILGIKLEGLDARIDEMIARSETLKNEVQNNQIAINSHIDVIERAKGELNGK